MGSVITIEADGEDEQAALDAVLAVIADKFGEGE
jgi:phosphocarrier protein